MPQSVGNLAHAEFVGHFFGIPLQSNGGGPDSYTEQSLSSVLAHLFGYVFLDLDTTQSFKNRVVATQETKRLGEVMQKAVADIKARRSPSLSKMFRTEPVDPYLSSYGSRLVERVLDKMGSVDDTVWTIIPTAAAASATQAQGVRVSS
jgi:hypothetical protein